MSEVTEFYEITVDEAVYRVTDEAKAGLSRICIYSDGHFRFSLPANTSREDVEEFVRIFEMGFTEGRRAGAHYAAERVRAALHQILRLS